MIRSLRRRHLAIWIALALLLPLLLAAALRARRGRPESAMPRELAPYSAPADDTGKGAR